MKAFLSHSSKDKEFVTKVAKELGRQFCVFDSFSFTTGKEFKRSIEEGLGESSVFVLFASQASLNKSLWVEFETDEAWMQRLQKNISSSLVYIIDSAVSIPDIPEWLQRGLIRRETVPKVIARDIRHHLDDLLRARQSPYFIGRMNEIAEIERCMTPTDGTPPPHSLILHGLPGVGRRTLIKKVSPGLLNLHKFLPLRIGEGDTINDICAIVADHMEPYSTQEGFQQILGEIRNLPEEAALERTLRNLRRSVAAGELPLLVDEGGIVDSQGLFTDPIRSILSSITADDDLYLVLILSRRPQEDASAAPPMVRANPLAQEETKRLLSLLANRIGLQLSATQISELAEYVRGYPPAAIFAVHQVEDYGIDLVLSNKQRLMEFQTSVFLRHFAEIGLSKEEQRLLRLLAFHSPLPLCVIVGVSGMDLPSLEQALLRLIDFSLLIVDESGLYRIADPVDDAASRAFGIPERDEHSAIASQLLDFLSQDDSEIPHLALSRVLFRAAKLAGDKDTASKTMRLAGDLIKLTETLYHLRRYSEGIEVGYSAVEERPRNEKARSFLIRALVQEERWDEAESQLSLFERIAPRREVQFLRGFMERNRNRIPEAIVLYEESERLGKRGAAINRELAQCRLLVGDLDGATKSIEQALVTHGDNPYLLDIWAKAATRKGDEQTARKALSRLEIVDKSFYYHRLSTVELAFANPSGAEAASEQAVYYEPSPPFHFVAQLANCKIVLGKLDEAQVIIATLDGRFSQTHLDDRLLLKARLAVAKGHYAEALNLTERFYDKSSYFHKSVRRDAIDGELRYSALKDEARTVLAKELASLEYQLQKAPRLDTYDFD